MSVCVEVAANGVIRRADQTVDDCNDFVLVSADQHAFLTQTIDITASEILEVFGITFGWVVFLSAIAFKIRIARRTIKSS